MSPTRQRIVLGHSSTCFQKRDSELGLRHYPSCSLWFYDLPKRQVDSFVDREFGFGDRMLPVLLHRSSHDDERSVACEECLRFSREVVPNTEFSRCP